MKSKKRSRSSGHGGGGGSGTGASFSASLSTWTGHDHEHRNQQKTERKRHKAMKKSSAREGDESFPVATTRHPRRDDDDDGERELEPSFAERKRAALTHGTREKKSEIQLRLHWARTHKKVDALRRRLASWDPDDESAIVVGLETDPVNDTSLIGADAADEGGNASKKRKGGRKGPESWKLRGAARPAHEVYDFDVRYVDPHQTAMDAAHSKARRTVNVLALYKGRGSTILLRLLPDKDGTAQGDDKLLTPRLLSLIRQYLALLMQYGHLSLELKRFKTAREAWLECVDLEGDPPDDGSSSSNSSLSDPGRDAPCSVTTAREELVRMDLQQMSSTSTSTSKRVQSAWKFLSERVPNDRSSWISYTRAVVACLLQRDDAEAYLVEAVRSNLYCAYYLAFWDQFRSAVEYTDDLCHSDDAPQTDLELALEYCSERVLTKAWQSSGAATALRRILVDGVRGRHSSLKQADVEINHRLDALQQELSNREGTHEHSPDDVVTGTPDPPHTSVDVEMYVGMFRTAVEMVQEAGLLL